MLTELVTAMALATTAQPPRAHQEIDGRVRRLADTRFVTLAEIVRHARRHAPSATVAKARISLGQAEQRAARPLLPSNPNVYFGAGARTNPMGRNVELQAQLSQALEIAGERGMRKDAANARRRALDKAHAASQWQAEVEARAAFHRALLAQRRADTARTAETFAKKVVATTRTLVEAGQESPLRLRLAEAEVARAAQARLDAGYRYRAACNELAKVAGWPTGLTLEPRGDLPPARGPGPTPVSELVDDHIATKTAKSEVRAAKARHRAALRDAWPHPTVGAYVASEQEPGTPFRSQVGLATVTIPIPLWRRNQGQRARARAEVRVAQARATVLQRNLARDLRRAHDAVSTAAERLSRYTEDVLPRFSENLELVQRSFEVGEIDVLEVFVARERFLKLQNQALDVYEDYITAVRDFELASGRRLASAPAS